MMDNNKYFDLSPNMFDSPSTADNYLLLVIGVVDSLLDLFPDTDQMFQI